MTRSPVSAESIKVFISSTITDLGPEREAVKEGIRELYLDPIFAEGFGARPGTPREECLKAVRESDIYIAIFWQRYGYITDRGISATEEEYQEARGHDKPILIYVKEPARRELLLTRFLRDLQDYGTGHLYNTFSTPEELKEQVKRDVMRIVSHWAKQAVEPRSQKRPSRGGIQVTVSGSPGAQVITAGRDIIRSFQEWTRRDAGWRQDAALDVTLLEEERQSLLRQISIHKRNLLLVEEQIAYYGMTPPLKLLNEKAYTEKQIAELERRLNSLGA